MPRKIATRTPEIAASDVVARMVSAPSRGRRARSSLHLWFRQNHDTLSAEFERVGPSWQHLADILGEHGLRNSDGNKPTAEGTRTVWYRVRREVAAAKAKRGGSPPPLPPGIRPVAQPEAPPVPLPVIQTDEDAAPAPRFKLASLRGATEADGPKAEPPAPVQPASPAPQPTQDVDAVLARLLGNAPQGFQPKPQGDE